MEQNTKEDEYLGVLCLGGGVEPDHFLHRAAAHPAGGEGADPRPAVPPGQVGRPPPGTDVTWCCAGWASPAPSRRTAARRRSSPVSTRCSASNTGRTTSTSNHGWSGQSTWLSWLVADADAYEVLFSVGCNLRRHSCNPYRNFIPINWTFVR